MHANVIDSCIDIIVGRPVIRKHHLIQKIPDYFDETTSSRHDLSQSVTPVTPSLAKLSRICAQPCTTCTPFVLQGYDSTLCSLTMKRPDRPLVPPERRRRPHVDAFADITPIDEFTLIESSQQSRTTMTSNGRQIHSKCVPRVQTPKRQMKSLP